MLLDPTSEDHLAGLNPELVGMIRNAAAALADQGIYFRVISGLRTAAQQDALWQQGRPDAHGVVVGKVVTNAKAGQSSHNYGLAVDAVPFSHGQSGSLNWSPSDPEYQAFVSAMKVAGMSWGGDWTHFKDMDHFYVGPANPTPEMIAAYRGGDDLDAVWSLPGVVDA